MYYNAGLVLEGGGMRGAYTTGVLDFLNENDIYFKDCYGVSAGSGNACSYLSGQKGRAIRVMVDYIGDKRYCSVGSLIKTGDMFGAEFVYYTIPQQLDIYDYDAFLRCKTNFYAVVTNLETGKAEYLPIKDLRVDMDKVLASSSLPLISRIQEIDGKKYLDGGIADSIPIRQSIKSGNGKNLVVLTRDISYRKKPSSVVGALKLKYRKYPYFVEANKNRYKEYNSALELIKREEKNGSIVAVRPQKPIEISRFEKDADKLKQLHEDGYNDACAKKDEIFELLKSAGEFEIK
ncbi:MULTISPECIES: patatin family protein [unclassified Ruminococcus]|uniref:patatin-like phospholipase family protein n=1 Tax=unclassified Ruminococcus TaxID=2608920 RepID=UPI00210B673F|nr:MULTISPECIES: patatin family protein [unclassified Ruminococcus]MCQ4021479.1 patatin family protein [Ruminococcus sp. zg-924]MCQ4113924.1 patatin family protein [Ruminococcus sp. zg-921]